MLILLGSENSSKKSALNKALQELEFQSYQIVCLHADSGVNSKPIGYEIIRGAENRNHELRKYAKRYGIMFDYLCSIEGGFSVDENGLPFVVTYAIVENFAGQKSTGKSLGIRLTSEMFDYVKQGGSLNEAIEKITSKVDNKQLMGIIGYLSGGKYSRDEVDSQAVISAFIPILFSFERDELTKEVRSQLAKDA